MPKTIIEFIKKFKKSIIALLIGGVALAATTGVLPDIPVKGTDEPKFVETLNDETVIKVRTWGCENWEKGYWWNTQSKPPKGAMCPDLRGGKLILMTDPSRMGTSTTIGPSYIENEIIQEDWDRKQKKEPKMTNAEKDAYRAKRFQDIQEAIEKAKLLEY